MAIDECGQTQVTVYQSWPDANIQYRTGHTLKNTFRLLTDYENSSEIRLQWYRAYDFKRSTTIYSSQTISLGKDG